MKLERGEAHLYTKHELYMNQLDMILALQKAGIIPDTHIICGCSVEDTEDRQVIIKWSEAQRNINIQQG